MYLEAQVRGEKVMPHMKMNIKKNPCPLTELPEGYTTTLIEVTDLTWKNIDNWLRIQHQRENVKNHDNLVLPVRGAATFAKYYGEIIACGMGKHISDDVIESGHLMVLPDHRRRGVFKALMGLMWRYSYLKGYSWINLSPAIQKTWWDKLGAEMGWAT